MLADPFDLLNSEAMRAAVEDLPMRPLGIVGIASFTCTSWERLKVERA